MNYPEGITCDHITIAINGPIRSGKSHIASLIIERLVDDGFRCVRTTGHTIGNNYEKIEVYRS